MTASFQARYDAHSRAVFQAFESHLKPFMANVTPDWLLHHMEIRRRDDFDRAIEEVEIRLVLRPIGSARVIDDGADLSTGPKRIEA